MRWFFDIFLPHVRVSPGKKVLIGDNLASHFSVEVVQAARDNDVYFTALPPNSTHLTQPLDVALFRPMKTTWKCILDTWRNETRRQGTIPKEVFPSLLAKLWRKMEPSAVTNLQGGFRKSGLSPFNPEEVLKTLPGYTIPDEERNDIGRALDDSLVKLLQENRGQGGQPKQKRGRKVQPGVAITVEHCTASRSTSATSPSEPGTSRGANADQPAVDENRCTECRVDYSNYGGPEWLQCIYCPAGFVVIVMGDPMPHTTAALHVARGI